MNKTPTSIKDLSLKEKIAQLFLMGFHGYECNKGSNLESLIKDHKPGGVILFDKDMVHNNPVHNIKSPDQLRELTSSLQSLSAIPLLIGIDQEGGLINRLKPEYGFPKTRSHQALGSIDNLKETKKEGALISKVLSEAGININFAPCVDLAINADSSIIAKRERSFGKEPDTVIKHAEAYIDGHSENKILTACKHFPGHGSASGDTHAGFVDVTDTWSDDELKPYEHLIDKRKCPVIMSSHIYNAKFDSDLPATLSKKTLTEFLRNKLGFDGVIISDDMQMKAISDHYGIKESLRLGLDAGVDIFCYGNNLLKEQIWLPDLLSNVIELIEEKRISEQRIDQSVERILNLKNGIVS